MGTPLIETITRWSGMPGTPWYTRMMWLWDGSRSAGQGAVDNMAALYDALPDVLGEGLVYAFGTSVRVVDDATGATVDALPTDGRSGSPGNFRSTNATQVQACVRLGTTQRFGSRPVQGRLYLPGVSSAAYTTEDPYLNTNAINRIAQVCADVLLVGPNQHPTVLPRVWSRTYNRSATVERIHVDSYLTTLRSRAAR